MGENSAIGWTGDTWNPFYGCKKISAGCKYCYMFRDMARYGRDPSVVTKSKTKFYDPLKWKEPRLIFTCSWSDWFIEEADQWRPELWKIIKNTPQHVYQILTKRPERIAANLPTDWGKGYPNVWLGVTVENQAAGDRVQHLVRNHAKVCFVSFEPLLEPINVRLIPSTHLLNWAIIGGESGNETGKYRYRPCDLAWITRLANDCTKQLHIPVFMKQLGTHLAKELKLKDRHGVVMAEWPEEIQVQQFPTGFNRSDYK